MYMSISQSCSGCCADIYGGMLSQSESTRTLFKVLKVKVDREVQFQKHAFQLLGSINTLLTAANITPHHTLIPPVKTHE